MLLAHLIGVRKDLGLSQEDIAMKIGRSRNFITKMEKRPEEDWSLKDLLSYANAVGLVLEVKIKSRD